MIKANKNVPKTSSIATLNIRIEWNPLLGSPKILEYLQSDISYILI